MLTISKQNIPLIIVTMAEPPEQGTMVVALALSRNLANGMLFMQAQNWDGDETTTYLAEGENLAVLYDDFEKMVDVYIKVFADMIKCEPIVNRLMITTEAGPGIACDVINEDGYFTLKSTSAELAKAECIAQAALYRNVMDAGIQ